MPLTSEIVRTHDGVATLESEWSSLLVRSGADTVFLTWEWIQSWMTVFGASVEPYVVTVRDSTGRLCALAPFYRANLTLLGVIPYQCLCVLGDRWVGSEYSDVIADRNGEHESLAQVGRELHERRADWTCVWLPKVAGWSGADERFDTWATGHGWCVQRRERNFSAIDLPPDEDAFWASLSGNMRSNLRRQRNQIARTVRTRFGVLREGAEISAVLDRFEHLHALRWASVGLPGAFRKSPGLRRFYDELCRRMGQTGWLRMYVLESDDGLVAMQFGFVYNGVYHQLQEGFDPHAVPGIGNLLRMESIRECIASGLQGYDFLGGATEHKHRWGAQVRHGHDYFIRRRALRTVPLRARELWPSGRYLRRDAVRRATSTT